MPSPIKKIVSSPQRITLVLAVTTIAIILIAAAAIVTYQSRVPRIAKINYSQLYQIAENGSAVSLAIESDTLTVQSKQGALLQATVTSEVIRQGVVEQFRKNDVPIEFRSVQTSWAITLLTWGAPLFTVLLMGFIGWRVYTSMNGSGASFCVGPQDGKQSVTFGDVAGVDEATSEVSETIDFLRIRRASAALAVAHLEASCFLDRRERERLCWREPSPARQGCLFFWRLVPAFRKSLLVLVRRACAAIRGRKETFALHYLH
jgi:hypothetical protein